MSEDLTLDNANDKNIDGIPDGIDGKIICYGAKGKTREDIISIALIAFDLTYLPIVTMSIRSTNDPRLSSVDFGTSIAYGRFKKLCNQPWAMINSTLILPGCVECFDGSFYYYPIRTKLMMKEYKFTLTLVNQILTVPSLKEQLIGDKIIKVDVIL
jgi:hypothetical protein